MAQIMKYWEWPTQGTGEHCYNAPVYGQQCANFGETTYDWANMIETYSSGSPTPEQKEAVAVLMYHCGVSVNMTYEPDGSGAFSVDVPDAINNYFSYSEHATHITKGGNYDEWIALLKSNIDQRIPLYYSGQSSDGGHAFVAAAQQREKADEMRQWATTHEGQANMYNMMSRDVDNATDMNAEYKLRLPHRLR